MDVCEIGSRVVPLGEIRAVKILGVLGMIDEGEMDWKCIAIDICDRDASKLNSIADVEKLKPGFIQRLTEWFKVYKVVFHRLIRLRIFRLRATDSPLSLTRCPTASQKTPLRLIRKSWTRTSL